MRVIRNQELLGLLFIIVISVVLERPMQGSLFHLSGKLIGILIVSMPMLAISILCPGSFGGGDIKLSAICGLLLGHSGILRASWIALLSASVYSLGLLIIKKSPKTEFALGPFICFGVLCVFLDIL